MKAREISEREACFLIGIPRSPCLYTPIPYPLNEKIRTRMRGLALKKRRYGSPRLTVLLRREFGEINHKRVERLYALGRPTFPRKRKKKSGIIERVSIPVPEGPNERWTMDFVHDSCDNGPEYISNAMRTWAKDNHIKLDFIQSGKPTQTAYVERFNRTARHDWLNMFIFQSVEQAQEIATKWLWHYNNERPHTANGGFPPRLVSRVA